MITPRICLVVVLVACAPCICSAATFTWSNATGGSYHTAGNWAPMVVPVGNNDAVFSSPNSDGVEVSAGSNIAIRTIRFSSVATELQLGGRSALVNNLILGNLANDAQATISQGTLNISTMSLGADLTLGTGTLRLHDVYASLAGFLGFAVGTHPAGGTLILANGTVAQAPGGIALGLLDQGFSRTALTVESGSQLTTAGLGLNKGVFVIRSGGQVDTPFVTASTQTSFDDVRLFIEDPGSKLTVGQRLTLGLRVDGRIEATVRNGGLLTVGNVVELGNSIRSFGSLSVQGTESKVVTASQLIVGKVGRGAVNITEEGYITSASAPSDPIYQGAGVIARDTGSRGSFRLHGLGSRWDANGAISIGHLGNGSLEIHNSAAVTCTEAEVARASGSEGLVYVGTGASWVIDSKLVLGGSVAGPNFQAFVDLQPGGSISVGQATRINHSGTIIFQGGRLDIGNGALLRDYEAFPPDAQFRALVASGFANGQWNGPGITSIAAASDQSLGIAVGNSALWPFPEFAGELVDATGTLVTVTLRGDANVDYAVNISDFALLAANFNSTGNWLVGDFNYDNQVNISDFSALASNFGRLYALPRNARSVPEVAALPTFLGALTWFRRRRA